MASATRTTPISHDTMRYLLTRYGFRPCAIRGIALSAYCLHLDGMGDEQAVREAVDTELDGIVTVHGDRKDLRAAMHVAVTEAYIANHKG